MVSLADIQLKIELLESKTERLHDELQACKTENDNLKLHVEITSKKQKEMIKLVQKAGSERGNSSQ